MNERLRWLGPEPEKRNKPTKKEIKRGGHNVRSNKKRKNKEWQEELQKLREEKI